MNPPGEGGGVGIITGADDDPGVNALFSRWRRMKSRRFRVSTARPFSVANARTSSSGIY